MFTFPAFFFWAENIQEGKFLKKLYEANFPLQRMTDETPPPPNKQLSNLFLWIIHRIMETLFLDQDPLSPSLQDKLYLLWSHRVIFY